MSSWAFFTITISWLCQITDFGSSWWYSALRGRDTHFIYGYNLWVFWVVWDTNFGISSSDVSVDLNLGLILIKNSAYEDQIFTVLRIRIDLTEKTKSISYFQYNTEQRRTKDLFWQISDNKRHLKRCHGLHWSQFQLHYAERRPKNILNAVHCLLDSFQSFYLPSFSHSWIKI